MYKESNSQLKKKYTFYNIYVSRYNVWYNERGYIIMHDFK